MCLNPRILLAMMLVAMPLIFVWNLELINYVPYLTNGFMDFDSMQIYHLTMYLMFLVNSFAAYFILSEDNGGGKK